MDGIRSAVCRRQAQRVIASLQNNRINAFFAETKEEVPALVASLLEDGCTVASGGSMTLRETGVIDLLRSGRYRYLDRDVPGLSADEVRQIYLDSFRADAYLASANAVTLHGELYNVDGNSNRIAAIAYGPATVILVVGCNKIVRDLTEAAARVKRAAAPTNAVRLHAATYCAKTGVCQQIDGAMTAGCSSDARICCNYLVSGWQRQPGRIQVILVGESVGY